MRCKLPRLVKTRWKQPKHASWTSYVNAMVGFRPSPGLQRAVAGSSDIMSARAATSMTCPCVGLGPLGVIPDSQHTGVGSALMHAMIGAADAAGEPLIALLGDPSYYSRFGFVPSTDLRIEAPKVQWGPHFQILPLTAWNDSITGSFRYSTPFDNVS